MAQVVEILPHVRQAITYLHSQYHGCSLRRQGMGYHNIGFVEPE